MLHWACFEANAGLLYGLKTKEKLITSHIIAANARGKKTLTPIWSQGKASASHPGCKWTPLGWYAIASKAIPDIWWGDVMTAPAVTGTAVHFPLEWAELPSPCGLMVCVWVCPSASKHGYWQGALATQLIPRYNNISNCTQVNWEPPARRLHHYTLHSYEVNCFTQDFFVIREDIFLWSDRHVNYWWNCWWVLCCSLCFSQRGSREPEEKVLLMHALLHDWCFSPLAWASIYFITTLFTPWLCTSWGLGVQSAKRAILIAYWNSQLWWMDTR